MLRSRPARSGYISDSELLRCAFALAERAHGEQRRATDQTRFIEHVIEVGDLLHAAGFDERLVAAGLLHDAVERGQLSEADLRAEMDDDICALVMALTEDATIEPFGRRKEALREQVRGGGTRAVTIFAADKLSDIRGLARGVALICGLDRSPHGDERRSDDASLRGQRPHDRDDAPELRVHP